MTHYVEMETLTDPETPDVVLVVGRHGKHGHLWVEIEGDHPETGEAILFGLALGRDEAARLGAIISRMLAEEPQP